MTKTKQLNPCDHGHDTEGKIKLLPLGGYPMHGNIIVCKRHYLEELEFRKYNRWDKTEVNFPKWEKLKEYK